MTDFSEVLLEQARQQLARQEQAVDTMRNRATAVLTACGLVAAFFGSHAFSSQHRSGAVWVALILFALAGLCTGFVLAPRKMAFTERLDQWIDWVESAAAADDLATVGMRGLANNLDELWNINQDPVERLSRWYLALCALFVLQAVAWAVTLV